MTNQSPFFESQFAIQHSGLSGSYNNHSLDTLCEEPQVASIRDISTDLPGSTYRECVSYHVLYGKPVFWGLAFLILFNSIIQS